MAKIKVGSKNNTVSAVVKNTKGEQLNVQMANWMVSNPVEGFITPVIENKGDKYTFTYNMQGAMTLKDFLKFPLDRGTVCVLFDSLVKTLSTLGNHYMEYANVLVSMETVLIDLNTKKVVLMYYPVTGYNNGIFFNIFMEEIISAHKNPKGEKVDYLTDLRVLLKHPENISWDALNKAIEQMKMPGNTFIQNNIQSAVQNIAWDQTVNPAVQPQFNQPIPQEFVQPQFVAEPVAPVMETPVVEPVVESLTQEPVIEEPIVENTPVVEENPLGKICPNCGFENTANSKFCVKCGTPLPEITAAPTVEATILLTDPVIPRKYPYLVRTMGGEKTIIDKDIFTIGKGEECDYIVENPNVSRNHVEIRYEAGQYYLVDMESTNHTYVNGLVIQPNVPIELNNETAIILANEAFTYLMD